MRLVEGTPSSVPPVLICPDWAEGMIVKALTAQLQLLKSGPHHISGLGEEYAMSYRPRSQGFLASLAHVVGCNFGCLPAAGGEPGGATVSVLFVGREESVTRAASAYRCLADIMLKPGRNTEPRRNWRAGFLMGVSARFRQQVVIHSAFDELQPPEGLARPKGATWMRDQPVFGQGEWLRHGSAVGAGA